MDNATLMYIVIGLLFIFFVVLLVFSAKSWRVLHMITAFLVFIAAGFLMYFTAATLRTHQEWRSAYNSLTTKVEEQELRQQTLLVGVTQAAEAAADSLRQAEADRERVIMDRGRIWRGCTPEIADDVITLAVRAPSAPPVDGEEPAEPPAEEPPAAEPPAGEESPPPVPVERHGITKDSIVYAFLEGDSALSGDLKGAPPFMVPKLYLGEFRVTDRTDTSITLEPAARLSPLQQASLGDGTWTIYETMPVDAHYAFDGLSEEDLRALFPQERMTFSDQEYNSRIAQLASLFEGKTPADIAAMIPRDKLLLTDEQYAALIDQYRQSGAEVKNPDDFPPDTIWKEVKLLSPVSIQVDAVLRDLKGTTYTQSYDMTAATAVKGPQNKVVIGDAELLNHWLTAIEAAGEQDKFSEIGQLRLALAVSTALKRTSDFNIPELWEDTAPPAPPVLKQLDNLAQAPREQKAALEAVIDAKSVTFDIGDTALLHPETAKFLIENKLAEEGKSVYVRPLRDYAYSFDDSQREEVLFEDTARVMKTDTATLVAANARALEQETYRADEISKLKADREGFQREAAAITALAGQVETRYNKLRAKLSELFKANQQLAGTIKSLQQRWAAAGQAAPTPTTPVPSEAVTAP